MRLSIQRLRWVLIAAALLLIVVLAAFIGYGRYRALKAYRRILAHSGITLTHDSNGVTYSQSIQGRKIFTVRAKTESSLGNGKWALHDAEIFVYNRTGDHPDHIYGSEMEYDEKAQIARARGEVFMDLVAPQGLADSGRTSLQPSAPAPIVKGTAGSTPVIHVRTSGLVYQRKLGIASTDQQLQFSYGNMQCTALGADFNSSQSTLRLLANVHMDGQAHGQPLHILAASADMERDADLVHLAHPTVHSADRNARADLATLHLRKDGSIEHLQGMGHVDLIAATRHITANRLDAALNVQSIPQTARLSGDVLLIDSDPMKPMHGAASVVDTAFDAQGSPTSILATGAAKLSLSDHRVDPRGLARSLEAEKILALLEPNPHTSSSQLKEIHATGSAHASGESIATVAKAPVADNSKPLPLKTMQVAADDLRMLFTGAQDGKPRLQRLLGAGHTLLQQDAPLGENETTTADTLDLIFAAAPNPPHTATPDQGAINLASATQTGHVTLHDRAASKSPSATTNPTEVASISSGTADRAAFDGATQTLTLTGNAHLYGTNAALIAPTISLNQRTQNADASGGVQATFENTSTPTSTQQGSAKSVTHVLSDSAHFEHATQLATFFGTDAQPARMWQDASQVQAATLLFDGGKRTFSARPSHPGSLIHAVFASNPSASKPGTAPRAASILRVTSAAMDYNDLQREATFSGGVSLDGTLGEVRGQHAVVLLTPAAQTSGTKPREPQTASLLQPPATPLGGSIDRVILYGAVQMDQPGRHGTGEQLLYTAATGSYILTGTPSDPPHIVDARQGNVTGATLVFGDAGSTIVVAGDPSAPRGKGGRVRSETHVSPTKEERQ